MYHSRLPYLGFHCHSETPVSVYFNITIRTFSILKLIKILSINFLVTFSLLNTFILSKKEVFNFNYQNNYWLRIGNTTLLGYKDKDTFITSFMSSETILNFT